MTGAVFTAPAERIDHDRMVRAHTSAARELNVAASGSSVWGWQGRTLGRRADRHWLRLLCSPLEKAGGHLWEGTATAQAALPPSVPRPALHHVLDWTSGEHAYRAELTEYVHTKPLEAGSPVLSRDVHLPDAWWGDLRKALADTSTTPTSRVAVRQGWVDKSFARFLGIPPVQITATQTGHGDLHWANITGPPLALLDWEGWGRMPVGFDVGLLHAYSLTCPATARRIRKEFHQMLNSPEGRVGELVAVGQILQVVHRGGHPELAAPLKLHAERLTGAPVPEAEG
ncbi:hypothetical protein ACFWXD_17455 [[Kitasatospora] papulosa]|uniref:hypothetical protein n=1 Tax=[Kitasatospora] papulosa TaxID=1464011 RepID=UPI0036D14E61